MKSEDFLALETCDIADFSEKVNVKVLTKRLQLIFRGNKERTVLKKSV